jgi:hypothetical protein
MSKKHFIELADTIKDHNASMHGLGHDLTQPFTSDQIDALAMFCAYQNPRFNRARWLGYIAGENGPSGGRIKKEKTQ